jgi:hypothetical protein
MIVNRFDLLCEKGNGIGFHEGSVAQVKILGGNKVPVNLSDCRAISHPSNNSIFLI